MTIIFLLYRTEETNFRVPLRHDEGTSEAEVGKKICFDNKLYFP